MDTDEHLPSGWSSARLRAGRGDEIWAWKPSTTVVTAGTIKAQLLWIDHQARIRKGTPESPIPDVNPATESVICKF